MRDVADGGGEHPGRKRALEGDGPELNPAPKAAEHGRLERRASAAVRRANDKAAQHVDDGGGRCAQRIVDGGTLLLRDGEPLVAYFFRQQRQELDENRVRGAERPAHALDRLGRLPQRRRHPHHKVDHARGDGREQSPIKGRGRREQLR
jgi:hypothetical protein